MHVDVSHLFHNLGLAAGYSSIGLIAIVLGYFMWDLLTPGGRIGDALLGGTVTRQGVTTETKSWNAALLLASGWLGNALIAGWSIFNTTAGTSGAVTYCAAFSLLGLILQGVAFTLIDLLTPGKLNRIICEPGFHPYSIAIAAVNVGVAFVVMASITP